jgi:hypothetical protein
MRNDFKKRFIPNDKKFLILLINVGMGERDGQVYPDFDIENINENYDVKVTSLCSSTGMMTTTSMLNKFINTNWETK